MQSFYESSLLLVLIRGYYYNIILVNTAALMMCSDEIRVLDIYHQGITDEFLRSNLQSPLRDFTFVKNRGMELTLKLSRSDF